MSQLFTIKICGITCVEDALAARDAGADAIGLNFYEKSPRCVSCETAAEIVEALNRSLRVVGVFVNSKHAMVAETAAALSLDAVQLHGDEPPDYLAQISGLKVVRAFRPQADLNSVAQYLSECRRLACSPQMVLIDAYNAQAYGGTGDRADWQMLATGRSALGTLPLVLAGGLNPQNVADAIDAVRPEAIDTASGVEISPGKKSAEEMAAFVAAAKPAFAALAPSG